MQVNITEAKRLELVDATNADGRKKWARQQMADKDGNPLSRWRFDQLYFFGKGDEDACNRCLSFLETKKAKAFIKAEREAKKAVA